jgi:hypothetical protein
VRLSVRFSDRRNIQFGDRALIESQPPRTFSPQPVQPLTAENSVQASSLPFPRANFLPGKCAYTPSHSLLETFLYMTSRQTRKLRREHERKAKKAAYKASLHGAPPVPELPLEEEFTPEFLAEAQAMRERIERRVATRAEINRANAQHSTGPVTPTGKLASSRNSLKHGLASGTLIIPGEDPAAFESLLETLLAEHQPANATEEILVHEMAQSFWLAQRALRLQNECFTREGLNEKRLALFLRYHTTHQRAFHKALNALLKLKRSRHRDKGAVAVPGFVSQNDHLPEPETRFVSQNDVDTWRFGVSAADRAAVGLLSTQKSSADSVQKSRNG